MNSHVKMMFLMMLLLTSIALPATYAAQPPQQEQHEEPAVESPEEDATEIENVQNPNMDDSMLPELGVQAMTPTDRSLYDYKVVQGNCIKIGVKSTGSFGVRGNTTPGIQYNKGCRGVFSDNYDFVTPQTPHEVISIKLDGSLYASSNAACTYWYSSLCTRFYNNLVDTASVYDQSNQLYRGTRWQNRIVTKGTKSGLFDIENDIRFNDNDKRIEITTYLTPKRNFSTAYISRSVDSDAQIVPGDTNATYNQLGYSVVGSKYLVFSETWVSKAVMGFYTGEELNTGAGISYSWSQDPETYYLRNNDGNGDWAIGIAKRITSLVAGRTYTFRYSYVFGESAYKAVVYAVSVGAGGGTPGKVPGCTTGCTIVNTGPVGPTVTPNPYITPTKTKTPTPSNPISARNIAVGASFTLAVLHNGDLVTWGFNREGQASLPAWLKGVPIKQVSVGSNYAIALGRNGTVYGWGSNDFGQLNIPVAAKSNVVEISASLGHVMARKKDGTLVMWGRNTYGQIEKPSTVGKVLAISAGHSHSVVIRKDGKVVNWGDKSLGRLRIPVRTGNVTQISAGFDHTLALRSDGTAICWGVNTYGQCTIPKRLRFVEVHAGREYSMGLTRTGQVYAWGRNNYGQVVVPKSVGRNAVAIAAGYVHSAIGLRDGGIIAFGEALHGALITRTPTP
jgi:hypothetical protein